MASLLSPGRWPVPSATRNVVLDSAVARGDAEAARIVRTETAGASHPGSPEAVRRAAAVDVEARNLVGRERETEHTVARYLRGELPRAAPSAPRAPGEAARAAAAAAGRLRVAGHGRPIVVATFPGFHANPFSTLMELAYPRHGLAAVHVASIDEIAEVVTGRETGRYGAVLHVNGPDRFVHDVRGGTDEEALADADRVVAQLDSWLADGVSLVTTVHNGPMLHDRRAAAEQRVAQAVVDRANLVHLLTASTPDVLAGWLDLSMARTVHVPHPNYDEVLGAPADRALARRSLDVAADVDGDGGEVLLGLVGSLYGRKGAIALIEAFEAVPDPLPDGRRLRLLLAGSLAANGEALIRAACDDERIITRFGYVPDEDLRTLLAAIDVAVVPYGRYLNSGWLNLALTAGVPVIAPASGTAAEVVRADALRAFDPDQPGSLAHALASAPSLTTSVARAAARASVASLDAPTMSERFVEALLAATSSTVRA
jgi:glycosyltransferase involved in cell wall biosynthesis